MKEINPSFLNKDSNVSSLVVIPADYGNFGNSDPDLANRLPTVTTNVNLGITSPGFLDPSMSCTGLDYINTNPSYNTNNIFDSQYTLPKTTIDNLFKNAEYTFSALSDSDKKQYLDTFKRFINSVDNNNKKVKFEPDKIIKENFEHGNFKKKKDKCNNKLNNNLFYFVLFFFIVIVVIMLIKN